MEEHMRKIEENMDRNQANEGDSVVKKDQSFGCRDIARSKESESETIGNENKATNLTFPETEDKNVTDVVKDNTSISTYSSELNAPSATLDECADQVSQARECQGKETEHEKSRKEKTKTMTKRNLDKFIDDTRDTGRMLGNRKFNHASVGALEEEHVSSQKIKKDNSDFVFFWRKDSPFSQWHESEFIVDGKIFTCAEQFMMYNKAKLFGDEEVADDVMLTNDPREHKKLGRLVRNFNQKLWDENCMNIVERGNFAKFTQNERLKNEILNTGKKTLVEASPLDRIWGIGLEAHDERAWSKRTWRGKNLLGYALTRVRDEIRQCEESKYFDTYVGQLGTGEQPISVKPDNTSMKKISKKDLNPNKQGKTSDKKQDRWGYKRNQKKMKELDTTQRQMERCSEERKVDGKREACNSSEERTEKNIEFNRNKNGNKEGRINRANKRLKISREHPEFVFFWGKEYVYSQWHKSEFVADGKTFTCTEQFMMYQKAIMFNDEEVAKKVMGTSDPREQKKLGRQVKNFNKKRWNESCFDIVKRGNFEKFTQNEELKMEILSTGKKILVEANPYDKIWGIGLTAEDERAWSKETWEGDNLLGFALTEVRDDIRKIEKLDGGKSDENVEFKQKEKNENCSTYAKSITNKVCGTEEKSIDATQEQPPNSEHADAKETMKDTLSESSHENSTTKNYENGARYFEANPKQASAIENISYAGALKGTNTENANNITSKIITKIDNVASDHTEMRSHSASSCRTDENKEIMGKENLYGNTKANEKKEIDTNEMKINIARSGTAKYETGPVNENENKTELEEREGNENVENNNKKKSKENQEIFV